MDISIGLQILLIFLDITRYPTGLLNDCERLVRYVERSHTDHGIGRGRARFALQFQVVFFQSQVSLPNLTTNIIGIIFISFHPLANSASIT
jgi:hypothetical protein